MNNMEQSDKRALLLKIFSYAVSAVNGQHCVSEYLAHKPLPTAKVRVIAIGKAAASMMQGVLARYAHQVDAGLVITKPGHKEDFSQTSVAVTQIESAHPYPDARSLAAGAQLLAFIRQTPSDIGFVFLISGGASSLVEVLPEEIDARQLHELNVWLLAQGWPIDVMNRIRKSISLIKAGRLARLLGDHEVMQLLISDVPGDVLSVIGSGLLVPEQDLAQLPDTLPAWLQRLQGRVPSAPLPSDACFSNIKTHLIAGNTHLREAAARAAHDLGFPLQWNACLSGEAELQGHAIARQLIDGPAGIYLWGGETVVTLPQQPGRGGRCQQLALSAAQDLAGHDDIVLLALGSDGTDGPGDVAGALVDSQTLLRAQDAGMSDSALALRNADAGSFLAASGDLVDTGPTGTNVMDIVIGLKS